MIERKRSNNIWIFSFVVLSVVVLFGLFVYVYYSHHLNKVISQIKNFKSVSLLNSERENSNKEFYRLFVYDIPNYNRRNWARLGSLESISLLIDKNGLLYITDTGSGKIKVFRFENSRLREISNIPINRTLNSLVVDGKNNVYGITVLGELVKYSPEGVLLNRFGEKECMHGVFKDDCLMIPNNCPFFQSLLCSGKYQYRMRLFKQKLFLSKGLCSSGREANNKSYLIGGIDNENGELHLESGKKIIIGTYGRSGNRYLIEKESNLGLKIEVYNPSDHLISAFPVQGETVQYIEFLGEDKKGNVYFYIERSLNKEKHFECRRWECAPIPTEIVAEVQKYNLRGDLLSTINIGETWKIIQHCDCNNIKVVGTLIGVDWNTGDIWNIISVCRESGKLLLGRWTTNRN